MERGMEAVKNASVVIERFRARYSFADSIYSKLGWPGHQRPLTENEVHAELCYAESLMFRAVLTFFYDESLITPFIQPRWNQLRF